jgi:hypothetical protein
MGVLTILNIATGIVSLLTGVVPEIIAIKNALDQSGANFQTSIQTLETDVLKTTGDTIADIEAWKTAHPA